MFGTNQVVQAKYVHAKPYGTSKGSLKVYIPSLMPNITMGLPKSTPVALNKSCYCNASECKPSVSSQLNTQNYVTADKPYSPFNEDCYYYGSGIAVISKTADCLSCQLSPSNGDNSKEWPE